MYPYIQKTFGRLKADPMSRLPSQAGMAKWILEAGLEIENKRFFELGTGHVPVAPIGFFLCGAASVITVDLHRRIEWGLTQKSLVWISEHQDEVRSLYKGLVDETLLHKRLSLLCRYKNDPVACLKEARIEYLAPMDAAHTQLPENSIDYHFSITVLEHISHKDVISIFQEASRVLKPQGLAIHFIDPSDHFQHQDGSIHALNFLRFSEKEWEKIAGNQFAYCNRLRACEYSEIFENAGFEIIRQEKTTDAQAGHDIENGFPIDGRFSNFKGEDILCTNLKVILKKKSSEEN